MPTTRQRRAQLEAEASVQAQSVAHRKAQYERDIAGVLSQPLTRQALIVSLVPLLGAYGRWLWKAGREQGHLDAQLGAPPSPSST